MEEYVATSIVVWLSPWLVRITLMLAYYCFKLLCSNAVLVPSALLYYLLTTFHTLPT